MARTPKSPKASWILTDFAQVRALADPLRLRILAELARAERTTKQVADLLGEKPTRLYNHVRALERAGLVKLMRTRPNRGTVERYYRAVGSRFAVPQSLFSLEGGERTSSKAIEAVSALLESAGRSIAGALSDRDRPIAPLAARAVICGTKAELEAVRGAVLAFLKRLEARSQPVRGKRQATAETATYAVTIAFHPLDKA